MVAEHESYILILAPEPTVEEGRSPLVNFFYGNASLARDVSLVMGLNNDLAPTPAILALRKELLFDLSIVLMTADTIAMCLEAKEYAERNFFKGHVLDGITTGNDALDRVFRQIRSFVRHSTDPDIREELNVLSETWREFHPGEPFYSPAQLETQLEPQHDE